MNTLLTFFKRLRAHRYIKTYGINPEHWDTAKLSHLEEGLKQAKTHDDTFALLKSEKMLSEDLSQLTEAIPVPEEAPVELKSKLLHDANQFLKNYQVPKPSENLFREIFLKDLKISFASCAVAILFSIAFLYGRATLSSSSHLVSDETALFSDVTFFMNSGDLAVEQEMLLLTSKP